MEQSALLTGSTLRHFARYVSRNVVSMLGLSLYILADTFFVANGVGSAGLTALNLVLPVYSFINGMGLLFGMGGATLYSIGRGSGERDHTTVFSQTVTVAAVVGCLIAVAGMFAVTPLVRLLGAEGAVLDYAVEYLRIIFLFAPAYLLNNVLVCFVRNDGRPNLAMAAMLAGSFGNIILDYVFVFPLQMEMFGAALATGIAPVMGLCVSALHFIRKRNQFAFARFRFNFKALRRTVSLGASSFLNEFSSGFVIMVFNFVILSIAGNIGVAAYGIVANLALIAIAVFTGIAQGVQPLLSVYHGVGEKKKVFTVLKYGFLTAFALGGLFYLIGNLFPEAIVSLFNGEGSKTLSQMAGGGVRTYFSSFLPAGLNIVLISFYASTARPVQSFLLSAGRGFVFVIPALLFLSSALGLNGVWWSVPLAEAAAFLLGLGFLLFGRKSNKS